MTSLVPYQAEYIDLALQWNILRFGGPYTLKSGRQSPYFFNAGLFNSGMKLQKMAECYANRIVDSGVEFDVLFNRKEAKTHGEGGNLIGAPLKGRVLVIDDVITAGTAINEAVDIINAQEDAKLVGVVIALDRQERASDDTTESAITQVEKRLGIKVYSVVTLEQIIKHMESTRGDAARADIESMRAYRERYGSS